MMGYWGRHEQVDGAFQVFHAYFGLLFGRREALDHSRHYLQALLVQSASGATPRICPRRWAYPLGQCSGFSPNPPTSLSEKNVWRSGEGMMGRASNQWSSR